jgi:hypothetical protein
MRAPRAAPERPAAPLLVVACRYRQYREDGFWVRLLGMDRRWLMRKDLAPGGGGK